MTYTCPVCGYPRLTEPPRGTNGGGSYEICPCCGFQFGYDDDDAGITFSEWRARWIENNMAWWSGSQARPDGWDPAQQLRSLSDE